MVVTAALGMGSEGNRLCPAEGCQTAAPVGLMMVGVSSSTIGRDQRGAGYVALLAHNPFRGRTVFGKGTEGGPCG